MTIGEYLFISTLQSIYVIMQEVSNNINRIIWMSGYLKDTYPDEKEDENQKV